MKTQDVIKSGIDRNFLRKCVKLELITPKKIDNEWIVNKNYVPCDYSQEEVEIVWNAYLYRKMGLSYAQIKDFTQGKEISIRDTLNYLIKKYEKQIEELQALIEFMKYVKGIGFIPAPPDTLMGSTNFINYLTDYIEYIDKDKKIKKTLNMLEYVSEVDDTQSLKTEDIDQFETLYHELAPEINKEDNDAYSLAFSELNDMVHLNPSCDEVQSVIHKIYYHHKRIIHNDSLTAWKFASEFIYMFSLDSDTSVAYKKILGEKLFDFFNKALVEFLIIQEPDKINRILEKSQQTDKVKQ